MYIAYCDTCGKRFYRLVRYPQDDDGEKPVAQNSKSRKLDQYIVRFPDGMREQLKELATEHNRSLNAEIIARLAEFQAMDEMLFAALEENKKLSATNTLLMEQIDRQDGFLAGLTTQVKDLSERVLYAEGKADAYVDSVKLMASIMAAISGNDTETMKLVANAIRSLIPPAGDGEQDRTDVKKARDQAKSQAVERLAVAIRANAKAG